MLQKAPVVKFCLLYIAGVCLGWFFTIPVWWILSALIVSLPLTFAIHFLVKKTRISNVFYCLILILFGVLRISNDAKLRTDKTISNYAGNEGANAVLKGNIAERAHRTARNAQFVVEAESLTIRGVTIPVEGDIIARVFGENIDDGMIKSLAYGKQVELHGEIQLPARARNPGEFDYRQYLLLQGIFAQVTVRDQRDIISGGQSGNWFLARIVHPSREWVSKTMDELVGGDEAKLLKGLVIGERSEISPNVKQAFTNAGLMHLLAVSGFNVGLVTFMLWQICSLLRIPRNVMGAFTILGVGFFAIFTGGSSSVVRAAIMATIFILGKINEERINFYNVLAISAMIILVIDPRQLFDVGFQLSFMATLALAYLHPKFMDFLKNNVPGILVKNAFVKEYIILATIVSLAATVGTLPLSAFYFHKVSLIGIVLNLVAVPLSGIILGLGFAIVGAALISTWLGSVYAGLAFWLAKGLLWMTELGGNLSWSSIPFSISLYWVIPLLLLPYIIGEWKRMPVRKWSIISLALAGNIMIYSSVFASAKPVLRVTMIDVGQGDAIFLEFPDGKNMLVDAGPAGGGYDAGMRFVAPFLETKGIKKINALVVSHPHSDHLGGAPYIMRHFDLDTIYDGGSEANSLLAKDYKHLIDSLNIPYRRLTKGAMLSFGRNERVFVLHPDPDNPTLGKSNLNNQSVVAKIVYGKTSLLLEGDAEKEVENKLLKEYGTLLDCDVLKAGHHGSSTSSTEEYIAQVTPNVALVSVGYKNKFRHPSSAVIQRFRTKNCLPLRTDREGAVILESDGRSWNVVKWRND